MENENTSTDPAPAEQVITPADVADPAPAPAEATETAPATESILGTEEGATPKEGAEETSPAPADPAPADDGYDALIEGIKDDESITIGKAFGGDEIKMGSADLKAIYPVLRKIGVPSDKANAVAKAFAAYNGARLKTENEQFVKAINARADECKKVFGNDLPRVKTNAVKGLNMMDKTLREELLATPVLLNDSRFIRFLAEVGEKFAVDDGGVGRTNSSAVNGEYNPSAWVASSNRGK